MRTRTTYLSELDAARVENERLGEWLRNAQEQLLQKEKMLNKVIKFIEHQSGSEHIEYLKFRRINKGHAKTWGSEFVITGEDILDSKMRGR